jgi:hypothetical protein
LSFDGSNEEPTLLNREWMRSVYQNAVSWKGLTEALQLLGYRKPSAGNQPYIDYSHNNLFQNRSHQFRGTITIVRTIFVERRLQFYWEIAERNRGILSSAQYSAEN